MQKELSKKEMVVLLDNAETELKKVKQTLEEITNELNAMYSENKQIQDKLNIAMYLIENVNKRNEELEKENKFFKEIMINA